jgi:Zn-dependent alcohol dehydrogenase
LEHNVTVTINEEVIVTDPVPTIKSTATITDGVDSVSATAIVGVDLNQKGMQTAQQFGAASSYGKKYALGNLFLIDDTQDSDATNDHGKSKAVTKIKQAAKSEITRNQFTKAVEYVKSGGDVEAIKLKYKLTTDQENYLNEQTTDNKETL